MQARGNLKAGWRCKPVWRCTKFAGNYFSAEKTEARSGVGFMYTKYNVSA